MELRSYCLTMALRGLGCKPIAGLEMDLILLGGLSLS